MPWEEPCRSGRSWIPLPRVKSPRASSSAIHSSPATTCSAATVTFTAAACDLNILPAGRLDANAIKLLNLYPTPTSGGISSNFTTSPAISENRNAFDTRMDLNLSDKNQIFYRFSYVDDPQFIPGIFGGVADGGGFQEGPHPPVAQQSALAWTHVFSPTMVNVARAGLNYLHTTRVSPAANDLSDLPGQYGISGIPQDHENGGLPAFGIQGLQTLGSNAFLPSDEVSSTFQVTDDFTKIYGKHTFKMGFEFQHVKFSTLQPPWSRGQFNFDGVYTNIPGASVSSNNTGIAQFLLTPIASTVGGPDYVGGPGAQGQGNAVYVSNISLTDNGKNYYGSYINDDWKVTPKLTVNLGLRWDFFGLVFEHHGAQANFVPGGPPTGSPLYLLPSGTNSANLSTSFTTLLATDGIGLVIGNKYGKGLGNSEYHNFAPRVGSAYQVTPKLVARGGFGLFYNGFENRGFSPNLGENYPFQFNFQYAAANDNTPITYPGCASPTATPIGSATLETDSLARRLVRLWSMPAVWRCAESSSTTRLRTRWGQLHCPVSAHAIDVGPGWLRNLPGTPFGGLPQLQQRYPDRGYRRRHEELRTVPGLRARIELRHHQWQQLVPLAADQSGKAVCQRLELPGHLHVLQDRDRCGQLA